VRLHDGLYLRMALGLGLGGALVSSDSRAIGDYSFAGSGGALDLLIGGTPLPGLALGGALSALGIDNDRRKVDGQTIAGDVTGNLGMLGFFADAFPDPEGGFHFGGALGVASSASEIKGGRKFQGGGLGLEAWGGYDFWVSEQWSLGGVARLMGSVTRETRDEAKFESSVGGFTLSFSALYH